MLKNILKNNLVYFIHKIFYCIPILYTLLWKKKLSRWTIKIEIQWQGKYIWEDLVTNKKILRGTFYLMW